MAERLPNRSACKPPTTAARLSVTTQYNGLAAHVLRIPRNILKTIGRFFDIQCYAQHLTCQVTYQLDCSMTAPVPLIDVFEFFEDPRNLARITPPWLNFRILDPDGIRMRAGAEIDYIIKWLGVSMKWKTLITEYDPPHRFVDEQARGPYSLWHHEHTFEETAAGVEIRDRVTYRLPLGFLGDIAHALVVKRQLLEIFRFRQVAIAKLLGAPGIVYGEPKVSAVRPL